MPTNDKRRLRKARKEHRCTEDYRTIKPGDIYLYAEMAPWHEFNQSKKWQFIRACLRCAERFGLHNSDTRKQLEELICPLSLNGPEPPKPQ